MTDLNITPVATKATLRAQLDAAGASYAPKANLAALTELVAALAPAAPATPAPAPVTTKPVQVAPGLKIEKDRVEQNGIKRPSLGGRCRAVWDALDAYRDETGETPTAQVVKDLAADEGWNPNNASIEFYQWRKFNGITGRAPKVAAAVVAE